MIKCPFHNIIAIYKTNTPEFEYTPAMTFENDEEVSTCPSAVPATTIETETIETNEIKNFSELGLDARLTRAVNQIGIDSPTLIQSQSIPIALTGKDILARAPTGSGKTLAYVLPVLHKILNHASDKVTEGISVQAVILLPTKELALQVTSVVDRISRYCTKDALRFCNLAQEDSLSLQQAALQATSANLILSTPSRLLPHLSSGLIKLEAGCFHTLVLDEADLILSFGFQADLDRLVPFLPKLFQTLLLSATLSDDLDNLKALLLHAPVIVKVDDEVIEGDADVPQGRTLKQYSIPASGDDKFLFTYVTLKLNLLRGKILIFCNSTDRAYKLKLYLDQFGVKCAVLNAELPLLSRHGIVDQFNRSVFDVLIASDDTTNQSQSSRKRSKEGGVARGVDFKRVDVVFNFDFPPSLESYTHRVGRTARGKDGKGTALSLIDVESDSSESIESVRSAVKLTDFPFPMDQLEAFRYRSLDALRSTTKSAIKKARASELSKQILASQKLSTTFFANRPKDLQILRNDAAIRGKGVRIQQHMKHVPGYLLEGVGAKTAKKRRNEDTQSEPVSSVNSNDTQVNSTTGSGLFDTKKQKRFNYRTQSMTPVETKKPEPQVILAPEHLKLPQTAPITIGRKFYGGNRKKEISGKNKKKNDPLKSGRLMN